MRYRKAMLCAAMMTMVFMGTLGCGKSEDASSEEAATTEAVAVEEENDYDRIGNYTLLDESQTEVPLAVNLQLDHAGSITLEDGRKDINWSDIYVTMADDSSEQYEYTIEGDALLLKIDEDTWVTYTKEDQSDIAGNYLLEDADEELAPEIVTLEEDHSAVLTYPDTGLRAGWDDIHIIREDMHEIYEYTIEGDTLLLNIDGENWISYSRE